MSGHPSEQPIVRPFFLTKGRAKSVGTDLPIETLVVRVHGPRGGERPVDARILDMCHEPLSIAEVSAYLKVPVGVARVLVSDLAAQGAMTVFENDKIDEITLVKRLINGIQAL